MVHWKGIGDIIARLPQAHKCEQWACLWDTLSCAERLSAIRRIVLQRLSGLFVAIQANSLSVMNG